MGRGAGQGPAPPVARRPASAGDSFRAGLPLQQQPAPAPGRRGGLAGGAAGPAWPPRGQARFDPWPADGHRPGAGRGSPTSLAASPLSWRRRLGVWHPEAPAARPVPEAPARRPAAPLRTSSGASMSTAATGNARSRKIIRLLCVVASWRARGITFTPYPLGRLLGSREGGVSRCNYVVTERESGMKHSYRGGGCP